jgi:hypothetical protein
MVGRKHDATGRSTGKLLNRDKKYLKTPRDVAWVWLPATLLNSPAWRSMSHNARRLIDRLMLEHTNHACLENGNLPVTYQQFVEYGLSRRLIPDAIEELEFLRLIEVTERGGRLGEKKMPNRFRLTWLGTLDEPPASKWDSLSREAIEVWHENQVMVKAARKARRVKAKRAKKGLEVVAGTELED